MSSEGLHEAEEKLSPDTIDRHRAIVSLMEELEAVDWYSQRVDATQDDELKAILAHNRDEEIEHAAMVLEWLRRNSSKFDEELRNYLFTEKSIVAAEEDATGEAVSSSAAAGSLGIGGLRGGNGQ